MTNARQPEDGQRPEDGPLLLAPPGLWRKTQDATPGGSASLAGLCGLRNDSRAKPHGSLRSIPAQQGKEPVNDVEPHTPLKERSLPLAASNLPPLSMLAGTRLRSRSVRPSPSPHPFPHPRPRPQEEEKRAGPGLPAASWLFVLMVRRRRRSLREAPSLAQVSTPGVRCRNENRELNRPTEADSIR